MLCNVALLNATFAIQKERIEQIPRQLESFQYEFYLTHTEIFVFLTEDGANVGVHAVDVAVG